MTKILSISDHIDKINENSVVVVRVDFNVPLNHSKIGWRVANDERIKASLPTIQLVSQRGAKVVLISHLGRPKSDKDKHLSLEPVAKYLTEKLHIPVRFVPDLIGQKAHQAIMEAKSGDVLLLENLRFFQEEKANDQEFSKKLASLGNLYVNEAFSASHRAHASVVGITKYLPSFAGIRLTEEISILNNLIDKPKKPFVLIIGGAKISDKVGMLKYLASKADLILVGGACANTFLKAEGLEIYRSRVEEIDAENKNAFVKLAKELITQVKTEKVLKDNYIPLPKLLFPFDVLAGRKIDEKNRDKVKKIALHTNMKDEEENEPWMYLDIGPKTRQLYAELIAQAETVFWNGPMGVWENPLFATGTRTIARAIVQSRAHSVVGGGDTIAAAHHFHLDRKFSFVSIAGGAALEYLSGKTLPGIKPLIKFTPN